MGDLVQPGTCLGSVLEAVQVAIGFDERVLGEVGSEFGISNHPIDICVDLAVMGGEEILDEGAVGYALDCALIVRIGRGGHADPRSPCRGVESQCHVARLS